MNSKFSKRLQEYLESECSDYDLSFTWEWDEDCQWCKVVITRYELNKELHFRYNDKKDELMIELSEDSYYITKEYDWSVKYFWMLICPAFFRNNQQITKGTNI